MLHLNKIYFPHLFSYKKTIFDEDKKTWKLPYDFRQLKKTPQIFSNFSNIRKVNNLKSQQLEYFDIWFSTLKIIRPAQNKINHWIS